MDGHIIVSRSGGQRLQLDVDVVEGGFSLEGGTIYIKMVEPETATTPAHFVFDSGDLTWYLADIYFTKYDASTGTTALWSKMTVVTHSESVGDRTFTFDEG